LTCFSRCTTTGTPRCGGNDNEDWIELHQSNGAGELVWLVLFRHLPSSNYNKKEKVCFSFHCDSFYGCVLSLQYLSLILLNRKMLFWVSAEEGVDLPPWDIQFNAWTIYTMYHPFESSECAAFFSMWREYNPLGHMIGKVYGSHPKITAKNVVSPAFRKKIFQTMKDNLQFEESSKC